MAAGPPGGEDHLHTCRSGRRRRQVNAGAGSAPGRGAAPPTGAALGDGRAGSDALPRGGSAGAPGPIWRAARAARLGEPVGEVRLRWRADIISGLALELRQAAEECYRDSAANDRRREILDTAQALAAAVSNR